MERSITLYWSDTITMRRSLMRDEDNMGKWMFGTGIVGENWLSLNTKEGLLSGKVRWWSGLPEGPNTAVWYFRTCGNKTSYCLNKNKCCKGSYEI